jgi:hypothetical protein
MEEKEELGVLEVQLDPPPIADPWMCIDGQTTLK